jgi:hypothetical protein
MAKVFEQFDLFKDTSLKKDPSHNPPIKKSSPTPFPNILLDSLNDTNTQANAVYYLRIVNKSSQKRLFNTGNILDKKVFFISLLNEINLKQGKKNPVLCCRDTILRQTLLSQKR